MSNMEGGSMSSMYVDALERYCIDKLHCTLEELEKLKEVYSYLAEDYITDDILKGTLNEVLDKVYREVSLHLALYIEFHYSVSTYIEVTDKEGTRFVGYELNEKSISDLKEVITKLKNCTPSCEDLSKAKFNNYLDETVDFYEDLSANAQYLIQYLIDEDIINPGEEVD